MVPGRYFCWQPIIFTKSPKNVWRVTPATFIIKFFKFWLGGLSGLQVNLNTLRPDIEYATSPHLNQWWPCLQRHNHHSASMSQQRLLSDFQSHESLNVVDILINSAPPRAANMPQWSGSELVQIMAWRLLGTKPLPEPMQTFCQLKPWEQTSVKFKSKYKTFHSRKCIWKCHL